MEQVLNHVAHPVRYSRQLISDFVPFFSHQVMPVSCMLSWLLRSLLLIMSYLVTATSKNDESAKTVPKSLYC